MNTKEVDYHQQAINFLQETNTSISFKFKSHAPYFQDDKESRDIWNVTMKNKRHTYRFTFGQSIANEGTQPTAYDVLACVQKYEVGTFENFCNEFGYDTDSRKAEKTYKAVVKQYQNIYTLFTTEKLDLLEQIQ